MKVNNQTGKANKEVLAKNQQPQADNQELQGNVAHLSIENMRLIKN